MRSFAFRMLGAMGRLAGVPGLALAILSVSPSAMAQNSERAITVYNAQHITLTEAWVAAFSKETGIKVTLRNAGDSELGNQIVTEGKQTRADVFLTENSPAMTLVEGAGLFAPVPSDILANVPDAYRPGSGKWIGIAARTTVFAYDKTKLTPDKLPKSIMDLAKTAWKDRWAASPTGADFQAIVSAMLQLEGEQATATWLKAMKSNARSIRGNAAAMRAVNRGEVAGAIIYQYYWFGDQAKSGENSGNVALHYFRNNDPGAFISISGGGVLATSKRPDLAFQFLKWITGPGGQSVLRDGDSFEYAVGVGAKSNPKLEPLDKLQAPKVDPATLNSKKVIDLMMQAGLL